MSLLFPLKCFIVLPFLYLLLFLLFLLSASLQPTFMLLKKRQGFKFTNDENHRKTSVSGSSTTSLDKMLRYTGSNKSSQEQPEDILADSIIFQAEKPPIWKRKRFHFIIGLSVGLIAAYGASTTPVAQTHLNDLQSYLSLQLAEMDWDSIIPVTDMVDELFGNVTNFFTPTPSSDQPFMPALEYREALDLKPHFPVVLIPGIISSGLESWGTLEKSKRFFRKRMWGTTSNVLECSVGTKRAPANQCCDIKPCLDRFYWIKSCGLSI